jgi:hypothetical protein
MVMVLMVVLVVVLVPFGGHVRGSLISGGRRGFYIHRSVTVSAIRVFQTVQERLLTHGNGLFAGWEKERKRMKVGV